MRLSWLSFAVCAALCLPAGAWAVSCTTQSEMTQADRAMYEQVARTLGQQIQSGDVAAVRGNTIAAVAERFGPIAATIERTAPEIQKAVLTVNALYGLKATDTKPGSGTTEFFCAVPNS